MSQTAPYQPPPLVPDELLQASLTAAQKLVWITVRKVQGQNPVAWGSVAYYVERSGVSKRSVISALAVLEQQGWIRRDGREIQCLNPLATGAESAPNGAKPAPEESAKSAPPGAKTARQSAKSAPPSESKQESKQRIQTHPPNPHGGDGGPGSPEELSSGGESEESPEIAPPPDPPPKPDPIPYAEIIADLNARTDSRYKPGGRETRKLIHARWAEGHRLDDFRRVHAVKAAEWGGTERARYLRPQTLYGTKFEAYLNQPDPPQRSGKPPSSGNPDARNDPQGTFQRFYDA